MDFLTKDQSEELVRYILGTLATSVNELDDELLFADSVTLKNIWNKPSLSLAKDVFDVICMKNPNKLYIYISEYGAWPYSENIHLFKCLQTANGGSAPLYEKPGHEFDANDRDNFVSFLHLALLFGWGGIAFSDSRIAALFSHDGWMKLGARGLNNIEILEAYKKIGIASS